MSHLCPQRVRWQRGGREGERARDKQEGGGRKESRAKKTGGDEGASRPRSETQADLHSHYCVPGWNLAACLTRRGRSGGQPGTPEARFLHRKSSGGSWNRGSVVADAARGPPEGCARVARETTFLARPGARSEDHGGACLAPASGAVLPFCRRRSGSGSGTLLFSSCPRSIST